MEGKAELGKVMTPVNMTLKGKAELGKVMIPVNMILTSRERGRSAITYNLSEKAKPTNPPHCHLELPRTFYFLKSHSLAPLS